MKKALVVRHALLASTAIALIGTSAYAADLPRRPAYQPPPPIVVAPAYNWTGWYVGGNVGAAWGRAEFNANNSGTASATNSGFAGGGQIGCDYQFGGGFVIGIRNMFDGTNLHSSGTFGAPVAGYTGSSNMSWFDTLTARLGYAVQPNWLLYGQGGAAWMRSNQWVINPAGVQVGQIGNNTTGWTVGGGTEYMFAPHWSAFLEYNYMNFGTSSGTFNVGSTPVSVNVKRDAQNVLVGINYRF